MVLAVPPPPRPALHLACALPKGDRQQVLLDMATQLGMTQFTPLHCERSVVKPGANSPARWKKICLEACKQSRRLHLPAMESLATVKNVTARAVAGGARVWIAHPAEDARALIDAVSLTPGDVTVLVGPEGGFTPEEVNQAIAQGAGFISLGKPILRIETAAVALLSAFASVPARAPVNPRVGSPPIDRD